MVTILTTCWQVLSKVELRRIFDAVNSEPTRVSHAFLKKNMVRYTRLHGRFTHCIFTLAVRKPPVLAFCIEIYYSFFKNYAFLQKNLWWPSLFHNYVEYGHIFLLFREILNFWIDVHHLKFFNFDLKFVISDPWYIMLSKIIARKNVPVKGLTFLLSSPRTLILIIISSNTNYFIKLSRRCLYRRAGCYRYKI